MIDFILVVVNITDIATSYNLLLSSNDQDEQAENFIKKNLSDWNLMFDKAKNWTTITSNERLTTKLQISREIIVIQDKLMNVKVEIAKLEAERKYKRLLFVVDVLALVTASTSYWYTSTVLRKSTRTASMASVCGLGTAIAYQVHQSTSIESAIWSLTEHHQALMIERDQLCQTLT